MSVNEKLIQPIKEGQPTIKVARSVGFTINLQGYESARIDATIEVTGALENKEEVKQLVADELTAEIQKQIKDIVEQHDPDKTLLGYRK